MAHDVFISFKSEDKIIAEKIYAGLTVRGVPCWISSKDITPGADHKLEITPAIQNSQLMLLVFSSNTLKSNQITKEIDLAEERNVRIIPIRIEDVEPSGAFIYGLRGYQRLDIFEDLEARFDEHLTKIYQVVTTYLKQTGNNSEVLGAQSSTRSKTIRTFGNPANEKTESQVSNVLGDKKVRALEICDKNNSLANGPLAQIVQKELSITYANAYYYVSRVWKRPGNSEAAGHEHGRNDTSVQQKTIRSGAGPSKVDASVNAMTETRIGSEPEEESPVRSKTITVTSEAKRKKWGASTALLALGVIAGIAIGIFHFRAPSSISPEPPASSAGGAAKNPEPDKTVSSVATPDKSAKAEERPSVDLRKYSIEQAGHSIAAMLHAVRGGHENIMSQAIEKLNQLPRLDQGDRIAARAANNRGLDSFKRKSYREAAESFMQAVAADGSDVEAIDNLAYAYYMSRETAQALQWATAALVMNPVRSSAWFNLAKAYADSGRRQEAVSAFRLSHKFSDPAKATEFLRAYSEQPEASPDSKAAAVEALALVAQ